MTGINTVEARLHWTKNGKSETDFLDTLQFVAHETVEGETVISLPTDEEGNDEILLTTKAARHVAKQLIEVADAADVINIEEHQKQLLRDSPHNKGIVGMWQTIKMKLHEGKKLTKLERKKVEYDCRPRNLSMKCTQCNGAITVSSRPQDKGLNWCRYCAMITDGVHK